MANKNHYCWFTVSPTEKYAHNICWKYNPASSVCVGTRYVNDVARNTMPRTGDSRFYCCCSTRLSPTASPTRHEWKGRRRPIDPTSAAFSIARGRINRFQLGLLLSGEVNRYCIYKYTVGEPWAQLGRPLSYKMSLVRVKDVPPLCDFVWIWYHFLLFGCKGPPKSVIKTLKQLSLSASTYSNFLFTIGCPRNKTTTFGLAKRSA